MLITAKKSRQNTKLRQVQKKKKREAKLSKTEKNQFKLFAIFKSPEFLKGPILTTIGYTADDANKIVTLLVTRWLHARVNDLLLDWLI